MISFDKLYRGTTFFEDIYSNLPLWLCDILSHRVCSFLHGSYVYGTNTKDSDIDIVVIMKDDIDSIPNDIVSVKVDNKDIEFQFFKESDFIQMIKNHHIIALESLWLIGGTEYEGNYDYQKHFTLDKWKLRQTISGIVNNSWAKCHKKLVVEKDYDWYRAVKSLFHCIRLYDFGIQIASTGQIYNYSHANKIWEDLYTSDMIKTHKWEDYKDNYQKILNKYHSEFVKLCPKPASAYKNSKLYEVASNKKENKA